MKRETKSTKKWRFFKSGLPGIVWNPKENKPLADFLIGDPPGTFITEDSEIAKTLKAKGYPEIGLNDTEPPAYSVILPGRSLEEGENVPIVAGMTSPKIVEQRMAAITGGMKAPEIVI